MKGDRIKYTAGWDYVLAEDYSLMTGIIPPRRIEHKDEFVLDIDGRLTIFRRYPWDGASGGLDTKTAMRPSLVHDCFCEAMRTGELDYDTYSPQVHELLAKLALEDGMWEFRADAWERMTKTFRGGHPSHSDEHPILEAP